MRDGEGELFPEFDRDDAIAKLADDIMTEVPDSFKSRLVTAYAHQIPSCSVIFSVKEIKAPPEKTKIIEVSIIYLKPLVLRKQRIFLYIAMVLMLVGIGLIGSVTSTLTSFFTKEKSLTISNDKINMVLKMYDELNDSEKEIFTQTILSR